MENTIFILLRDSDMTMRSHCESFGKAVKSKELAEKWVKEKPEFGGDRAYSEVKIVDKIEDI